MEIRAYGASTLLAYSLRVPALPYHADGARATANWSMNRCGSLHKKLPPQRGQKGKLGVAPATLGLFPASINHREPTITPTPWRGNHAVKGRVNQFADRPDVIGHAELHRGRDPQRFVDPAEVVMRDV